MAGEYNTYGSDGGNRGGGSGGGYGDNRGSDRGGDRGDNRGYRGGGGGGSGRGRGRGDSRGDGRSRRPGIPLSALDPNLTGFSHKVIGMATEIHTVLGPGYDEATYMTALKNEMTAQGVRFVQNHSFDVKFMRDYVAAGTEPVGAQHTLAFRRDVETAIYNTLPHHIARVLRAHPLTCQMAFIGGTQSAEVRQIGMRTTERLAAGRVSWVEGSHLFPMERPIEAADRVIEVLRAM